ncbi:MAG: biopolymer transporter ExbD [Prevotella sp.]|nr:biopolymer transporter ExbD [Prevotella sp.]
MSRFRRRNHDVPGLNLASMPDLIFTVLFFFMIVTHMRQTELKVRYVVPQGTELEKTGYKGSVVYLYIGRPVDEQGKVMDAPPRIQLNDRIVSVQEIPGAVAEAREQMASEDRMRMTVSIHADRDVDMGLMNDVKQALRQAGALRINYSATNQEETVD